MMKLKMEVITQSKPEDLFSGLKINLKEDGSSTLKKKEHTKTKFKMD